MWLDRSGRMTLSRDLRRDALAYLRLDEGIAQHRVLGPAQEVDEAGGDDVVAGIERGDGRHRIEIADGHDLIAANTDVTAKPGRAGPVENASVADLEIEFHFWFGGGCTGRQSESADDRG